MLFEKGFEKVETAKFDAEKMGATLRRLAETAQESNAGEAAITLAYDKGAMPGDLVPEIVLRVRTVEDEDDEVEED
jgi:hypothetical protein